MVVTGRRLLVAASLRCVRRAGCRAGSMQLTQSYWELRYEYGQLRVAGVAAGSANRRTPGRRRPAPPRADDSFVPLSSLKR